MSKFLKSLFSTNEKEIDSLILGAFLILLVGLGLSIYAIIHDPSTWNPLTYSTGLSALLVALGGGKKLRDSSTPLPHDQEANDPTETK